MSERFEGWIEMAHVVDHLDEIVHIDDASLAHLLILAVDIEQFLALQCALQPHRSLASCHHSLPAPHLMVVLKEAHVALVHEPKVYGVGIEQKLVVALLAVLHFLLAVACGCLFLQSALYRFQILPDYGLEQYIEGFLAEGRQHKLIIGGVHHYTAASMREDVDTVEEVEPRDVGQLYVEEYQVGLMLAHHSESVKSVVGDACHADLIVICEMLCQASGCILVVVDNDCFHKLYVMLVLFSFTFGV